MGSIKLSKLFYLSFELTQQHEFFSEKKLRSCDSNPGQVGVEANMLQPLTHWQCDQIGRNFAIWQFLKPTCRVVYSSKKVNFCHFQSILNTYEDSMSKNNA